MRNRNRAIVLGVCVGLPCETVTVQTLQHEPAARTQTLRSRANASHELGGESDDRTDGYSTVSSRYERGATVTPIRSSTTDRQR
jgi:hypothetical protein